MSRERSPEVHPVNMTRASTRGFVLGTFVHALRRVHPVNVA
jgi:hypothetical protein